MNPFYKNLALWMVIGLIVILLFQLFQQNQEDDDEADHHREGEVLVERIHAGNHTIGRAGPRGRPGGIRRA